MLTDFAGIENAYIIIAHDDSEYLKEIQAKIMEREGIVAIAFDRKPAAHSFVPGYLSMYSYVLPYMSPSYSNAILIKCKNAHTVIADLLEQISDVVSKIRKEGMVCVIPEHCIQKLNELDQKLLHPAIPFEELIHEQGIFLDCEFQDKWAMFECLSEKALELGWVQNKEQFLHDIHKRERIQSTGIGNQIAFPHTMSQTAIKPFLFVLVCKSDLEFESIDNQPVRIVLLLGLPKNNFSYIPTISKITKAFAHEENIKTLLGCKDKKDVVQFFNEG